MADKIHVDDVGTSFIITVMAGTAVLSLVDATSLVIIFGRPDGTYVEKEASLVTDGLDGRMRYISESGDLSMSGRWKIQGVVTFMNGKWSTDIDRFRVYSNIKPAA